jgi:hypothetical protein
LKYEFKLPIVAKMPDLVAEDLIIWLTARNINKPESCCEQGRFLYLYDVVEDGRHVPDLMKAAQHEILPSIQSSLISVQYHLDVAIVHAGPLGVSKKDVPSLEFPVNILLNPKGPLE